MFLANKIPPAGRGLTSRKSAGNSSQPVTAHYFIFTVLPVRFAKDPKADIEDLLPWNEKFKEL